MSTNGDTHLGGEDFDQRVMDYFIKLYKKKTNKNVRTDNRAVQKLRREVEKAKRTLSSQHQVLHLYTYVYLTHLYVCENEFVMSAWSLLVRLQFNCIIIIIET